MKKKIGISYTETNFQNYWNWFTPADLGDNLELIELSFEKNNVKDIELCAGFLLTGGIDVTPSFYGGALEYPGQPDIFLPERDEFEKLIYDYSQALKIPVLGICRGMQYINILEGGKVLEDIGSANLIHKKETEDKVHYVNIGHNSMLYAIIGSENGIVNSAHHQGVNGYSLSKNLIANCYADSPDQLIEGLEFKDKTDKSFMLAVQWHPERMKEKEINPLSQKLKDRFLEEVKKMEK
ncbi:gamma-glutamyl-gamma-aminobutyrate hydrolase family protein [Pedobacter cryoconitis]|uniref:gamma-glutamyl-gamma-aminobutyrate hydrolase family protein n=1 Tax=Pedobacter cryoconitis TaxID=188932 RepID=UPI0016169DAB|nr:gamma-glutamyl-gamma-aminobutyrate hydrolase family protein [Pedobacter cryoconitis]MBB5645570.1 putative glutamine amidotransferase [Pedobacter cryoconitis]